MDIVDTGTRSRMMANIRGKDTQPELRVRHLAHQLGYRFRLHRRDLPGSPDLVFPALHAVVLVHGCFWHRHAGCRNSTTPKSNAAFWARKLAANVERDRQARDALEDRGWRVLVIWECETHALDILGQRVSRFLGCYPAQKNTQTLSRLRQSL